MKDSVVEFFKDIINKEITQAKDRLANGSCSTIEAYQYEVCRIRTLNEAEEILKSAMKAAYNSKDED